MPKKGFKSAVPRLTVVVCSVAGVHSDVVHVPNGRRKRRLDTAHYVGVGDAPLHAMDGRSGRSTAEVQQRVLVLQHVAGRDLNKHKLQQAVIYRWAYVTTCMCKVSARSRLLHNH